MQVLQRNKYSLITFGLAFVIMLGGFAAIGVYPFGDRQMMVIDSWNQYYPFLQEFHRKLTTGDSLFYSWNMGMGVNAYVNFATYTMSPVNLLSVFFKSEQLREFFMLATVFKIACAGMFFSYYIKKHFEKNDITLVLFGLLYGFCGYLVGYYWNIMWLDAVALFPLVILGLNSHIRHGKTLLYTLTLALTLITNFYIGFLVCEFIVLYAVVLYFSHNTHFQLLHLLKKAGHVFLSSLLALGLSAVVLLPAYKGLQLTYAATSGFPKTFKFYHSIFDILNQMLTLAKPTVRDGLPNITSGILAICLVIVYFLAKEISLKDKLLNGGLIVFLLLSFNINSLNYIWHGFHFPNEVPYRFAFAFTFLILTLAYEGLLKLEQTSSKSLLISAGGFSLYLVAYGIYNPKDVSLWVFGVSFTFIVAYLVLYMLYRHMNLKKKRFAYLICLLVLAEVIISALNGAATTGANDRTSYPSKYNAVQIALKNIREKDQDFYRVEGSTWYSVNDPALYGYKGVSYFSSTINVAVSKYLQQLGIAAYPNSNRYLYTSTTPLLNGLTAVKYIWFRQLQPQKDNDSYTWVKDFDVISVFKNKYPLPLGFMVKDTIDDFKNQERNPFVVQDHFMKAATGLDAEVYHPVELHAESYDNMTPSAKTGIRQVYKNKDSKKVGTATLTYVTPDTKQTYLYLFSNRTYDATVEIDKVVTKHAIRRGHIMDLGLVKRGANVVVNFEVFANKEGYFDSQMIQFDAENYKPVYEDLADEPFIVSQAKSTFIAGDIKVKTTGRLYTSIPYDKGWTAKVDGVATPILPLKDAMITVPLTAGDHHVTFEFEPEGFRLGLGISGVSVVLMLMVYYFERRKVKQ